jgi:hypothetical protein
VGEENGFDSEHDSEKLLERGRSISCEYFSGTLGMKQSLFGGNALFPSALYILWHLGTYSWHSHQLLIYPKVEFRFSIHI